VFLIGYISSGHDATGRSLAVTVGLLMFALGLACIGLSGLALLAHPEYGAPEWAERLHAQHITPRAHALTLAWGGLSSAAVLALVAVAGLSVLLSAPVPAFYAGGVLLMLLWGGPAVALWVVGRLRRR